MGRCAVLLAVLCAAPASAASRGKCTADAEVLEVQTDTVVLARLENLTTTGTTQCELPPNKEVRIAVAPRSKAKGARFKVVRICAEAMGLVSCNPWAAEK